MSLDMDIDLQDRPAGGAFELAIDLQDRPDGSAFELAIGLQDRSAGSAAGLDRDFDRQERPGGEVSLDRLADVINEVLSVPSSEGLALLIRTQLDRATAPELSDSAVPAETAPELSGSAVPAEEAEA